MDGGNEESGHKILFQSRSIHDRNTNIGAKAFVNEAVNRSNVFSLYSQFRDGRELVEDDESGGRLNSTRTEANIAAVAADLVKNDRRIASRMIAKSLKISKNVVLPILKEDICPRDFILLHDNVSSHKANFYPPKMLQLLYHPPVSSTDLSPPEYFLFLKLKLRQKDLTLSMLPRSKKPSLINYGRSKKRSFR
jgi:hypothetical protein